MIIPLETIKKYGQPPFSIGLLHGGPGASGEMRPVAEHLAGEYGVIELIQTKDSIEGQVEELHQQLKSFADWPVILIGHSWGAWLGFIFASRYPELLKKLILVSAGSFESKYNKDLMETRLSRLNHQDRLETEHLMAIIQSGKEDKQILKRYGSLMAWADAFDYQPPDEDFVDFKPEIFRSVWTEASAWRDSSALIRCADLIKTPVVAIHGDYDPHPQEGVEKPLSERLADFRMIILRHCGHTPWLEKKGKKEFFEILHKELF